MHFEPKKPTVEEVKVYRKKYGGGFAEAAQRLRDREVVRTLAALRVYGTTDDKINWLLDRYEERFLRGVE